MLHKNESGFSLIEILVVSASLLGLATVTMSLTKSSSKSSVKYQYDSEINQITNELVGTLSSAVKCKAALNGQNALLTNSGISSINGSYYILSDTVNAPAGGYGNAKIRVSSYELSSTVPDIGTNVGYLNIYFENKVILNNMPTVLRKIKLYVEVDGSNLITNCRAIASNTSDIWLRGSGTDIFYNGKVSVGTLADPGYFILNGKETALSGLAPYTMEVTQTVSPTADSDAWFIPALFLAQSGGTNKNLTKGMSALIGDSYWFENTATLNSAYGTEGNVKNQASGTVNSGIGVSGQVINVIGGIINSAIGVQGYSSNFGTGNMTSGIGGNFAINNLGTGTISTAMAGNFNINRTTGTIGNGYGVYIGSIQSTNKWSLYSTDATAASYFAGNVGIGTTTPTTKLQVAGIISPEADATHDLGTSSLRFKDIYASNNVIQTSDARLKKEVQESDLGLKFINKLRAVSYYWKQGDDNKLHYGLIAQETQRALSDAKEVSNRQNEVDNVIVTHDEKTDRYGIRYTELISPLIKAVQELFSEVQSVLTRTRKFEIEKEEMQRKFTEKTNKLEAETKALKKENDKMKVRLIKIEKLLIKSN